MIVTNQNTQNIQGSEAMSTNANKLSLGKLSLYAVGIITLSIVAIELGRYIGGFV